MGEVLGAIFGLVLVTGVYVLPPMMVWSGSKRRTGKPSIGWTITAFILNFLGVALWAVFGSREPSKPERAMLNTSTDVPQPNRSITETTTQPVIGSGASWHVNRDSGIAPRSVVPGKRELILRAEEARVYDPIDGEMAPTRAVEVTTNGVPLLPVQVRGAMEHQTYYKGHGSIFEMHECVPCGGYGHPSGDQYGRCPHCQGVGWQHKDVTCQMCYSVSGLSTPECENCQGTGISGWRSSISPRLVGGPFRPRRQ